MNSNKNQQFPAQTSDEKMLLHLFEGCQIGVHMYKLEKDGRLIFIGANPAADTILHVDNRSYIGKTLEENFPSSASTEIPKQLRMVAQTGKPWQNEQINYEDDKIKGAFEVYAFQVAPNIMVSMFTDVTKKKQVQSAEQTSENRFKALIEHSEDIISIVDKEGKISYVSPSVVHILGYKPEEIINKDGLYFIHPNDQPRAGEMLKNIVSTPGASVRLRQRVKHKNGTWIWCEGVVTNLLSNELIQGVVSNFRDITPIKMKEEELEETGLRYKTIVNLTGQMIYDYNLTTGKISWFGAIQEVTGYSPQEFVDINIETWSEMIHEEDRARAVKTLDEAQKNLAIYMVTYRFQHKNGSYVYIEDHGAFLPDKTGKVHQMLGTMRDVSAQKSYEQDLKIRSEELVKMNDAMVGRELKMIELKDKVKALEIENKRLKEQTP